MPLGCKVELESEASTPTSKRFAWVAAGYACNRATDRQPKHRRYHDSASEGDALATLLLRVAWEWCVGVVLRCARHSPGVELRVRPHLTSLLSPVSTKLSCCIARANVPRAGPTSARNCPRKKATAEADYGAQWRTGGELITLTQRESIFLYVVITA